MSDRDVQKKYNEFWKEIVENPDGTINLEQLKKELSDFSFLIHSLSSLYSDITGGIASKPMTKISAVRKLYRQALQEQYDRGYADAKEDFDDSRDHKET